MGPIVHETSYVHPEAHLGHGVIIGPRVKIGAGAYIGDYTCIGGPPESTAFFGDVVERSICQGVEIGDCVKISEFVTVHAGTKMPTRIGAGSAIFAHTHIAHDSWIGEHVIIGGHVTIAGHCQLMDHCQVGGQAALHQRCTMGALSFLSATAFLKGNIPNGAKWIGNPARPAGWNDIGLERKQLTVCQCEERWGNEWTKRLEIAQT